MAQIRIEERRGGLGWLWAAVALLLLALAAWWFLSRANVVDEPAPAPTTTPSSLKAPAAPPLPARFLVA